MSAIQQNMGSKHASIIEDLSGIASVDRVYDAFSQWPVEEKRAFFQTLVSTPTLIDSEQPTNQSWTPPRMLFERLVHKYNETFEGKRDDQMIVARLAAKNCVRLPRPIGASDDMEDELKEVCIRSARSAEDKMRYLYPNMKDERNIFLDLTSVTQQIDLSYIDSLDSILRFEKFLEYAKLPQFKSRKKGPLAQDTNTGYKFVFDWLKKKKVVKIFEVTVDDLDSPGHGDREIISMLKGWHVKLWNWRRFDISSRTILQAAPDVEEVYLYSSGRKAVLDSWACEGGLVALQSLKRLNIVIRPEVETIQICDLHMREFDKEFWRTLNNAGRGGSVEWQTFLHVASQSSPIPRFSRFGHGSADQAPKHYWLDHMRTFAQDILNLDWTAYEETAYEGTEDEGTDYEWTEDENTGGKCADEETDKMPSVRVALIDTGVSIAPGLGITVEKGKSFCDAKSGFRDWFVEPFEHGTYMAYCIREICPVVKLYAARLDDTRGGSEFTVRSATRAVNWAVDMGVHIISMSWSFNEYDHASADVASFRQAISRAHQNNIILFAAMKDQGPVREDFRDYPIGLPETIGIGSATRYGKRAAYNTEGLGQFYLPGEEVILPSLDASGEKELKKETGSSIATAFAAGLAALILYCMMLDEMVPKEGKEGIAKKRLERARTTAGMAHIFRRMCRRDDFLEVWDVFPYELSETRIVQVNEIHDVVEQLLPALQLRTKNRY
ncbi:hypothetical protein F5Y10DRAFT_252199 [Nemania abortiva]|nr:hypothetical protein F5Y10DRAFT_252199 [Nemania abortiva]